MQKVIRIKLLKDPGGAGGFCMSVGSIIELYDGGFRSPEVNASYYPVFGPYELMQTLVEQFMNGTASAQAKELFEVVDVTGTIKPKLQHDIMDEAGGKVVCTVDHRGLMELLNDQLVKRNRISEVEDVYSVSNTLLLDDVLAHALTVA